MLTTSILFHNCQDHVIHTQISQRVLPNIRSIFLYHDQTEFSPYYLYMGTLEDIRSLFLRNPRVTDLTFVASRSTGKSSGGSFGGSSCDSSNGSFGGSSCNSSNGSSSFSSDDSSCSVFSDSVRSLQENLQNVTVPSQCSLIVCDLDLISLYNNISCTLDQYRTWNEKLSRAVKAGVSLEELLQTGYELMGVPMVLINNYYKSLANCIPEGCHDYILDEFQKNSFLCFDSIQSLHKNVTFEKQYSPFHREVILENGGRYIISRIIRFQTHVIARLSLHLPDDKPSRYLSDLSADLAHYVAESMSRNFSDTDQHFDDIDLLISDLIEQKITSMDEVEQRLSLLPSITMQRRYHLVLIRFHGKESKNLPWVFIKNQLLSVFPESNIAVYQNSVVILAKKEHKVVHLAFNEEQLTSLLSLYDGYAVIGNFSKFLTSLHAVYFQVHSVLPLIQALKKDPAQRIFHYEDYSIYHVIALCADSFLKTNPQDQLIYLCHPALIAVFRYDQKYGTNLMEVLQLYLANDRNSTQTAKDLFIHRNTLLYRLGKLEDIMGENLESQALRERLTFSFHLIEYMDKVLHQNPLF